MSNDAEQTTNQTELNGLRDATEGVVRRLGQLGRLGGDQRLAADALRTASAFVHDATRTKGETRHGVIVEALPHLQQYRVLLGGGKHISWCTRAHLLGTTDFGMRDNSSLAVGTRVLVTHLPFTSQGVITGTLPDLDAGNYSDIIVPGDSCAVLHRGFRQLISLVASLRGSGLQNCAAGAPIDNAADGAFNISATTGMMLHVDRYMAQLRLDEMTGLFLYYWDRFVRLCGYNFARWTANSILESYDDEGEHYSYEGWTTYPWEQRGILWDPANATINEKTLEEQREGAGYTRINPAETDQQPFHRLMKYKGYLGQGAKTYLCAPANTAQILRYSENVELPGLFEETLTLAGHYGVRTATGLTIAKRPIIPVPKRKKLPEEPSGDNRANYAPSGYNNADHKIEPTLSPGSGDDALSLLSTAGVLDLHAYLFNWESAHPFHLHARDFDFKEESETAQFSTNQAPLNWEELQNGGVLDAPEPETIALDHRNDAGVKVYPNTAYITLADDGSLIFGDGYGAEIRMGGGTIRLSAPGDVMLESGRNVMSWAGRDVILKAKENIEGSASNKDIKLKAEQNVEILAANNEGPHHLLLECRATEAGLHYGTGSGGSPPPEYDDNVIGPGIILNTQKSEIIGLANNVYMRAVATGSTYGRPNGVIALDAPSADGVVRTFSKYFINTTRCGVCHFFHDTPGANYFSSKYTNIGAGCNYFNGYVFSANSMITMGGLYGQAVLVTDCAPRKIKMEDLNSCVTPHWAWHQTGGILVNWFVSDLAINWQAGWGTIASTDNGRPGYIGSIPITGFEFPDAEKRGTTEFVIVESRWMNMARTDSTDITEPWVETAVAGQDGEDSWPFPGLTHESGSNKWYHIYDPVLYDVENGVSKDRSDAAYGTAQFGVLDERVFNEDYLSISLPE